MLVVVNRFRVSAPEQAAFRPELETALEALAAQRGYDDGRLGRNLDDPELWLMVTRWVNVGSYRRALSAYDVKVRAVPVLSHSIDEPSAYETLDAGPLNVDLPRQLG